jgi:deoxyribodipyrimidine photolyase-related protein
MAILRPIFNDQLSFSLASLSDYQEQDIIFFCERIEDKAHPKKIALSLAASRHFAAELQLKGYKIIYINFNDPLNSGNLTKEIAKLIKTYPLSKIVLTEPNNYQVKTIIESWDKIFNITIEIREDDRFLCSKEEFQKWSQGKKQLRMEHFYRIMRRKFNILIESDGSPKGGKWNYDQENRQAPSKGLKSLKRISHKKSEILQEVLRLVEEKFTKNFGLLQPFHYAITRDQALIELEHFINFILPNFGKNQDAMVKNEAYLDHSLLSSYINLGLLLPLEICKKAELAYLNGKAPLNSVEGFIRQILGWREFVRAIYWLKMPQYAELNYLEAKNPLPDFYWGEKTKMACLEEVILHTKIHSYSHHIQRLMVTGNFALIAGLDVKAVQEWYLAVYSDAYEWVEMPNTLGMTLFGDGGILASKPYAASGNYINKMSNFCKGCFYNVKENITNDACPFNALYWDFLDRNREKLGKNPRLALVYKRWDQFDTNKKSLILLKALDILTKMQYKLL